jgi:hypothetical protein
MRVRLISTAAISFALLTAGSGAAIAATNHSDGLPKALFGARLLLPGNSVHAHITVKAGRVAVKPYLDLSEVRQQCNLADCLPSPPALTQMLQLTAIDDAGQSWRGSLAAAQRRVELPGGTIPAEGHRTYQLTMSLPVDAGNSYEGLAVSGAFTWGGMDASHHVVSRSGPGRSALPFTGLDTVTMLAVAGCLLALGGTLIGAAKRRRQR